MKPLPDLFLITDSKKIDPLKAANKLPKNAGVILREYDMGFKEKLDLGKKLKKICHLKKIPLLIAGDFRLAHLLKADGMHLPEHMVGRARKIRAQQPDWIITTATHSRRAVKYAYDSKADAAIISPVFFTQSHPEKTPLGIFRANSYIYKGFPAYAMGGVTPRHLKNLKNVGFQGLAGISWINNCGG